MEGTIIYNISAIVPVYNVEEYLKTSVDSLANQTIKNIEIILVDDGSSDNSGEICDELSEKYEQVKVIHQSNSGASGARNNGIKHASGKYLYFMDPDDWMESDMLESMYNKAESVQAELVITGFTNEYYLNNESFSVKNSADSVDYRNIKDFRANAYKYFNNTYLAVPWNKLYLREYISKHDLKFPDIKWDDLHFNMEVIKDISTVSIMSDTKYHFLRSRPGSETTKVFDNSLFKKRKEQFEHIINVYEHWDMLNSKGIEYIYYYYASRLVEVAENVSNGDYSKSEKVAIINDILNDDLSTLAIHNEKSLSKLMELVLIAFKMNSPRMVYFNSVFISGFKNKFGKSFFKMKQSVMKK